MMPILVRTIEEAVQLFEIGGSKEVLKVCYISNVPYQVDLLFALQTRLRCLVDSMRTRSTGDMPVSTVHLTELPDLNASETVLNMLQVPQYGSARWRGLDVPSEIV